MYIYIAVFLISLIFIWLGTKAKNKFTYYVLTGIGLIIPCLLAAFRDYSIGTDIMVYQKPWFDLAKRMNFLMFTKYFQGSEILYYLITWISAHVFKGSIGLLFFLIQALIIIPVFISLKNLKKNDNDVLLGMFIYYMFWYNTTYNLSRQSIAIAFVILSLSYFEKNNYKKTMLFSIIAFLFHSSAIIICPIYAFIILVNNKSISKIRKIILEMFVLISSIIVLMNFNDLLLNMSQSNYYIIQKYGNYINIFSTNKAYTIGFHTIFWGIITISSWVYRRKIDVIASKLNYFYYLLPFIFVGIYLNSKIVYIQRIFYYIEMPYLLLIYNKIPNYLKDKENTTILSIMYVLLFIVYWYYVYVFANGSETVPYLFRH